MPEETSVPGDGLDQVPQGVTENPHLGRLPRRDPHMRSPEMLARAMLRARERAQNKENIAPDKPGARRRRQRRGLHSSRSPLPSDYPRAPLQDITAYMQVLQRSRTRARTRMPTHGITPLRQLFSPAQGIPAPVFSLQEMGAAVIHQTQVSEAPLQETETTITNPIMIQGLLETETTLIRSTMLPEQETQGVITQHETEVQYLERTMSHDEATNAENSFSVESVQGQPQDNQTHPIGRRSTSNLTDQDHGRAFGTVLPFGRRNARDAMGIGGNQPQAKKKSSLKPLMRMR